MLSVKGAGIALRQRMSKTRKRMWVSETTQIIIPAGMFPRLHQFKRFIFWWITNGCGYIKTTRPFFCLLDILDSLHKPTIKILNIFLYGYKFIVICFVKCGILCVPILCCKTFINIRKRISFYYHVPFCIMFSVYLLVWWWYMMSVHQTCLFFCRCGAGWNWKFCGCLVWR